MDTGSANVDSSIGSETPVTDVSANVDGDVIQAEVEQQPTETGFDIGWKYGEEESAEPTIPENDDDIQGMLNDPGLDEQRVPGVVQSLRDARAQARQFKTEAAQLREQVAQFEGFGGVEGVSQTLNMVGSLVSNPEQGAMPFLQSLYDSAYPAYEQVVRNVIQADPNFALAHLQQMGLVPQQLEQPAQINNEMMALIPDHLREVARTMPANALDDLMMQDEAVRNYHLERELKLSRLDSAQRAQEEQSWRQQVEQANSTGHSSIEQLSSQYETAHYNELSKWTPYGPENKDANQRVHREMVEGALSELLNDQKFQQMYIDARNLLTSSPHRRLRGEGLAADQDERKARQIAAQFNTRLGQLIRDRVKERDSIYRDARSWREHQRQQTPNRTEVGGISSNVTSGRGPATLTKDGRVSKEFIDSVVSSLPSLSAH